MILENINTIIWDLDNTLYPYTEEQIEGWHAACVHAAIDMGVPVAFEEGMQIARDAFLMHNFSSAFFKQRYELCDRTFHKKMNSYARAEILPICELTPRLFKSLPHVRHVLLTHASREWGERALTHLGLRCYFEEGHILGLEDYDFQHKHDNNTGLQKALDIVGGRAQETIFAEDTLKNLEQGKEEGVYTAYIHHGMFCSENDNKPDFVDLTYDKAHELLRDIVRAQSAKEDSNKRFSRQ